MQSKKDFKNPTKKEQRNFGLLISIVFALIGGAFLWFDKFGHYHFLLIALILLIFAVFFPQGLRLLYIGWMRIAKVLGIVMTGLIITLLFYLVFTPLGLLMRALGKRPLELKWDKERVSYWNYRSEESINKSDYERQF